MDHVGEMSMKSGAEEAADADELESTVADRRRPGRSPRVPPSLLPLLRRDALLPENPGPPGAVDGSAQIGDVAIGGVDHSTEAELEASGERVFMGVLVGALMATPFWLFAAIVIWWIAS